MNTIIENVEDLNITAPSPEETVSEATLTTNIARLADETTEPSPVKTPKVPKGLKAPAKPTPQQTPAYMPLPNTETTSGPIFLSRIRRGFWDLPEISFD